MLRKFAVILSGCGFKDGSEIHEATMSLLAIQRSGATYQCFAPDIDQHHVVDHLTGKPVEETRNVLRESARIARGKIKPLSQFKADEFDALLMPGGFGAALNLCSFGVDGANCQVNTDVKAAVMAMHKAQKPIGALCIAPVILGKLLSHVTITVGQAKDVNAALTKMGAVPQNTIAEEVVVDDANRVVTGPCYMLESNIVEIANGAQNVVDAMQKLVL